MQNQTVHFATNRIWMPEKADFGLSLAQPPARLLAGRCLCQASPDPRLEAVVGAPELVKERDPDAGLVDVLRAWLAAAAAAGATPILFCHGFNHSFRDAIARTASLAAWLEAGPGAPRFMPFAFTWPSNGEGSADAYRNDQADAAASGLALARLIAALASLVGARKPIYMAHSMGVRATRCGMQAILPLLPALRRPVFARAFLIAGDDETDVLDAPWRATGADPTQGGLRPMADLAEQVEIGVNRDDGVVWLVSGVVNQGKRLGAAGPAHPDDLPANVAVVDYSMTVSTEDKKPVPRTEIEMNWIGHQYQRNDVAVRADLLAAIAHGGPAASVPGRRPARLAGTAIDEIPGRLYPAP
jgi:esterase/lipase superfamily enzyme